MRGVNNGRFARGVCEAAVLGFIVAGALVLRLWGVRRGLPYLQEWDEPLVLTWVIGMIQRGDLDPHTYAYTNAYYYMLLPVMYLCYIYLHAHKLIMSPWDIQLFHPQAAYARYWWYISYPEFYLWGRVLTAFFGAATVFLIYRIGKVAFGSATGLLAAAVLAVAPGTIYYADTVRVDIPMMFFLMLAVLVGLRILERGLPRDYARAGLLAGLAVSTKPNAFFVILPLLIAHLLNPDRIHVFDRQLKRMGLFAVAGFALGTPLALIQPLAFFVRMSQNAPAYGFPSLSGMHAGLPLYLGYLIHPSQGQEWYVIPHVGIGLIPTAAAVLGLVAGFLWKPKVQLYLISFPIVYFIYTSGVHFLPLRYIVPVFPFVALLAAIGSVWVWRLLGAHWPLKGTIFIRVLAAAGIILLLFGPTRDSIKLAESMQADRDTRGLAVEWLEHHVPSGSRVAFEAELRWFLPDLNRLPFTALYPSRNEGLGWYLDHHIDFAAVGEQSPLRTSQVVARIPSPSYLPSSSQVATWSPDTFSVVDPSLLIIKLPTIQSAR